MHLNDHPTSVASRPANTADTGHQGWFADVAPGDGVPTVLTVDFMNSLTAELKNVLAAAGLSPNKADDTQLLTSIQTLLNSAGASGGTAPLGMTISPTPGHTTTRISIAPGACRDSTNSALISLLSAISKDITAVWSQGDGVGGRDSATALANNATYHVFAILDPTSGVVDALFSQSRTAPTLPAGFTKFRRVGSILLQVASTAIEQFVQKPGGVFMFVTPRADYANQSNGAGTPTLRTVSVPNGIKAYAAFSLQSNGTIDNNPYYSLVADPDDGVPGAWGLSTQRAQIRRLASSTPLGTQYSYGTVEFWEWTNASQQVYTFSSDSSDVIALKTRGWRDDLSQLL